MSQADITAAFNFDENDLALNKRGELSPSQIEHLKKARTVAAVTLFLLTLPAYGLAYLVSIATGPGPFITLGLYSLFVFGLAGIPTLRALLKLSNLSAVGVDSVVGLFEYDLNHNPSSRYFPFSVGGRRFKVKQPLGHVLKQHAHYRIYFLRELGGLLSIEVIDDTPQ